jgi:hypothetical protein
MAVVREGTKKLELLFKLFRGEVKRRGGRGWSPIRERVNDGKGGEQDGWVPPSAGRLDLNRTWVDLRPGT